MSRPECSVVGRSVELMPWPNVQKQNTVTVEAEPEPPQDNIQTEATTVETEPAKVQSNIQTKAAIIELAGGTRKSRTPKPVNYLA